MYDPTDEKLGGATVFRKRSNGDKWLAYHLADKSWKVQSTPDKGSNRGWATVDCELCLSEQVMAVTDSTTAEVGARVRVAVAEASLGLSSESRVGDLDALRSVALLPEGKI